MVYYMCASLKITGARKVGFLLRKLVFLLLLLTTFFLLSCNGRGSVAIVPSDSLMTFIDVDATTLADLIASESDMIVLISSDTCSSCSEFEPILVSYIELHHIPVYRIEADELFPTDNSLIAYEYTPTLVLYNEGEIVSQVDPFTDEEIFLNADGLSQYFDRYLTIGETSKT